VCGSKSPGLCFKPRDDTLYSLESDIRQTLRTLYAIHALETSRDLSRILDRFGTAGKASRDTLSL
jgi:hypothetical protein